MSRNPSDKHILSRSLNSLPPGKCQHESLAPIKCTIVLPESSPADADLCSQSQPSSSESFVSTFLKTDKKLEFSTSGHIQLPILKPPDGGYGWIVVLASFLCHAISEGIPISFGVLFVELSDAFQGSKSLTSLVGACMLAVPALFAPITSIFINSLGCRVVCVLGALICTLGFFVSFFLNSLPSLIVCVGIITGVGQSLIVLPSIVVVANYFYAKRAFAMGLSIAGVGVGTFIFSPLIDYLIRHYTWRGCMLFLSAFHFQILVFAVLFQPVENQYSKQQRRLLFALEDFVENSGLQVTNIDKYRGLNHAEKIRELKHLLLAPSCLLKDSSHPIKVDISQEKIECEKEIEKADVSFVECSNFTSNGHIRLNQYYLAQNEMELLNDGSSAAYLEAIKNSVPRATSPGSVHSLPTVLPSYNIDLQTHLKSKKDIYHFKAMWNSVRRKFCKESNDINVKTKFSQSVVKRFQVLRHLFNVSIFSDPAFLLLFVSNFMLFVFFDVTFFFLVDYVVHKGYSSTEGALLTSLTGIFSMFGQVLLGFLADLSCIGTLKLYVLCIVICGLVTVLVPIYTDFISLSIYSCTFGFTVAANDALIAVILADFMGLSKLTNAMGVMMFGQGAGNIIGPPLLGLIIEVWNFHLAFVISGFGIIISSVLALLILFYQGGFKCSLQDGNHPKAIIEIAMK